MKLRFLCAAGLFCVSFEPAAAQQLNVSGVCSGDAITVTLDVYDPGASQNLVGYDLYRGVLGFCAPSERLTEVPWSRESGQHFTRQLVDADRNPSVTYQYQVVGVDADRNPVELYPIPIYWMGSNTTGYSSCGPAPIGLGTLHDFGYTLAFQPCAGTCYFWTLLEQYPPNLWDYADTGTVLLLYGDIVCGTVEGCLLNVDSSIEASCTFAVAPATWGQVKTTYR